MVGQNTMIFTHNVHMSSYVSHTRSRDIGYIDHYKYATSYLWPRGWTRTQTQVVWRRQSQHHAAKGQVWLHQTM